MKKYIGQEEMSNANCACVLELIRRRGEIARKEIAQITHLSWGGMTKIVNRLFESGYIVEDKCENQVGYGRIPNVIRINREKHFVIGLDVNRMGLSAYVMNLAGEVLKEYTEEGAFDNKDDFLKTILSFLQNIVREQEAFHILAIGIAMQGIVDEEKGVSVRFPHCADWDHVPLRDILEEAFGVPVFIEHDPNCILYSVVQEEETENTLLMRIDSSVGMAVSIGGRILKGRGLMEIAHQIVVPDGKLCRCGQRGCLEAYIGPCFVKKELRPEAVGDMIEPLAITMRNMCHLFNAKKIILTGALMGHRAVFEEALLDAFYRYEDRQKVTVKFVDEANRAVYGAALTAVVGAIREIKI